MFLSTTNFVYSFLNLKKNIRQNSSITNYTLNMKTSMNSLILFSLPYDYSFWQFLFGGISATSIKSRKKSYIMTAEVPGGGERERRPKDLVWEESLGRIRSQIVPNKYGRVQKFFGISPPPSIHSEGPIRTVVTSPKNVVHCPPLCCAIWVLSKGVLLVGVFHFQVLE